jgi:hypothetical protein
MKRSQSIKGKVYKFIHRENVWIQTNLKIRETFDSQFLNVDTSGMITIKGDQESGYAWKMEFLDLVIGTPDGRLDYRTEEPITYYASMLHDAIYQFKSEVGISRKEADILFWIIMREAGFFWSGLYYSSVRLFGGFFGKWKKKTTMKDLKILDHSWSMEEDLLWI